MPLFNIITEPGAASKHKSFTNDILRNEVTPGIEDRRGSVKTHRYLNLNEKHYFKATLGASAKAKANRHLAAGSYGNRGVEAVVVAVAVAVALTNSSSSSSSASINSKKSGAKKGSQP
jgi:hypothetical protein